MADAVGEAPGKRRVAQRGRPSHRALRPRRP
jgi:hypothetical protein